MGKKRRCIAHVKDIPECANCFPTDRTWRGELGIWFDYAGWSTNQYANLIECLSSCLPAHRVHLLLSVESTIARLCSHRPPFQSPRYGHSLEADWAEDHVVSNDLILLATTELCCHCFSYRRPAVVIEKSQAFKDLKYGDLEMLHDSEAWLTGEMIMVGLRYVEQVSACQAISAGFHQTLVL